MPVRAIVGAQWGDEGKGKITDLLAQDADMVVRFGGGSNAGHTVVNEHGEFKLHLIPSGVFNPAAVNLIGTGTVVDFDALTAEAAALQSADVSTAGVRISSRAHLVLPYHLTLDRLQDEARGAETIGTTRRGVGPAYVDKADRIGIQAGDLCLPDVVRHKLTSTLTRKNQILHDEYGADPVDADELLLKAGEWVERWGGCIVDQVTLIDDALSANRSILLEGQLGALRDLDWGTYPFVTSSTTIAGGGAVGGGIPPMHIREVMGVVKAYTTAVGTGPVPAEIIGSEADRLREEGNEYGATTGRARRVGWFDAVATRYARMLNGFTALAVTKLDVLDGLERLKICIAYRYHGRRLLTVPLTAELEQVEPEYEEMPGWMRSTAEARSYDELPAETRAYLTRIEELTGAPIALISVGPAREQTIVRRP